MEVGKRVGAGKNVNREKEDEPGADEGQNV